MTGFSFQRADLNLTSSKFFSPGRYYVTHSMHEQGSESFLHSLYPFTHSRDGKLVREQLALKSKPRQLFAGESLVFVSPEISSSRQCPLPPAMYRLYARIRVIMGASAGCSAVLLPGCFLERAKQLPKKQGGCCCLVFDGLLKMTIDVAISFIILQVTFLGSEWI